MYFSGAYLSALYAAGKTEVVLKMAVSNGNIDKANSTATNGVGLTFIYQTITLTANMSDVAWSGFYYSGDIASPLTLTVEIK